MSIKIAFTVKQPCILCGDTCQASTCLCNACKDDLPYITDACHLCGLPVEKSVSVCGSCITTPPPANKCISVLHYDPPVDYLIKHMKYHNQLAIADLMGELIAVKIKNMAQTLPDVIIPVPLHVNRLRQRGYNQAIEISRLVSRRLNIPLNIAICTRVKHTPPQFDIPANERKNNIKNAFEVSSAIKAKHVALIDDVMTTGSTVWEITKTLKMAGVEQVDVWTCARASTD